MTYNVDEENLHNLAKPAKDREITKLLQSGKNIRPGMFPLSLCPVLAAELEACIRALYISAREFEKAGMLLESLEQRERQLAENGDQITADELNEKTEQISLQKKHENIFESVLSSLSATALWLWTGPHPIRGSLPANRPSVSRLMEWLFLNEIKGVDPYFCDRDGQSLMHYIAKDGFDEVFKLMIYKGYSPLIRDRSGSTAWEAGQPRSKFPPSLIIEYYVRHAYALMEESVFEIILLHKEVQPADNIRLSPGQFFSPGGISSIPLKSQNAYKDFLKSLRRNETIWINIDINDFALFTAVILKICEEKGFGPDDTSRVLEFQAQSFSEQEENHPARNFLKPSYDTLAFEARGSTQHPPEQGTSSVNNKQPSDDSQGSKPDSNAGQSPKTSLPNAGNEQLIKGSQDDQIAKIPPTTCSSNIDKVIEIVSAVFPYFDAGDLTTEKLASEYQLLQFENMDEYNEAEEPQPSNGSQNDIDAIGQRKWTEVHVLPRRTFYRNVHVRRTLDASYFLGLSGERLKEREKKNSDIRRDLPAESQMLLGVSHLWLWKFNNIVITALPRRNPENAPRSDLFNHTLSTLRKLSWSERRELSSDHLAAWILSECINRLDRPTMAGLPEPIFSFLSNSASQTLKEFQEYVNNDRLDGTDSHRERHFMNVVRFIRDRCTMLKNILLHQELIWGSFSNNFKGSLKETFHDNEPFARIYTKIKRAEEDIGTFKKLMERITDETRRVERDILTQLDLKNKTASLKQARTSVGIAYAVVGFAVITAIFTPLLFISSLLALPYDYFQSHQYNHSTSAIIPANAYRSGYIMRSMFVGELVSLCLTVIVVWLMVRKWVVSERK